MFSFVAEMKWVKYLGAFSLFWVAVHFVAGCFLFKRIPDRQLREAREKGPFDAIIVPGVPYDSVAGWNDIMKARVLWSKYLFDEGMAKNVIYSGSAVYTPYFESLIMAEYGHALGIPRANIFTESRAEHSTENLYYSWLIAQKEGFQKVAIASDPIQTFFLYRFSKRLDIEVSSIPMKLSLVKPEMEKPSPIIDHTAAFKSNFVALPDREGFFERLNGTIGKKIIMEKPKE